MKALKDPKTKMVPEEDARAYFEEWKSINNKQNGFIDMDFLQEMIEMFLIPWFLQPRSLACSTMDCHFDWDPCTNTWVEKKGE